MTRVLPWCCLTICTMVLTSSLCQAAPSESLLPNTTKGYLAIPDVDLLRSKFDETQLGQLANDPLMKPFADDLREQIKDKLDKQGVSLGLTWDDLQGVYGGEVCFAAIQPGGDKKAHGTVVLCDTTGKTQQAQALLAKVQANLVKKGGVPGKIQRGQIALTVITMPNKVPAQAPTVAVYALHKDLLLACTHLATAQDIADRMQGLQKANDLQTFPAFQEVMKQVDKAAASVAPHLRWWIEPFGYTEVTRAANGGRKQRGTDMLKVLEKQGFTAVQGLGGIVNFATPDHELLHRSFIYAPADAKAAKGDKYRLAARMLQFPNAAAHDPEPFIPRDVATYVTANWKMREAFEYVGSLVNQIADDPTLFEEVLKSIEQDPDGPKLNIRKELIAFLGERISLTTDYQLPIDPKSERFAIIVEVTDAKAVSEAVHKALGKDPTVKLRDYKGHKIYEIVNEEQEHPGLMIDGPGGASEKSDDPEEEEKPLLPNSAITILKRGGEDKGGWLIVATHIDFLQKLFDRQTEGETLKDAADRVLVNEALTKLKAGTEALRWFARTDESFRPTYELIQQGKMPQAETMLGKLLNKMLGPDEKNGVRRQVINGAKLPDFQVARRYLGPAGGYITSEEDGWMVTGCLLNKDGKRVEVAKQPAAEVK